jgi:heptosyltransferase III
VKNKSINSVKHVLISRTDSIGDVVLTLPMCAALKEKYPTIKITFLCKKYTQFVVSAFKAVDEVVLLEDLLESKNPVEQLKTLTIDACIHVFPNKQIAEWAKKAKIPFRIGTSHRLFHWMSCNIRPSFSRKKSNLHEAQLNFALITDFFNLNYPPSFDRLNNYIEQFQPDNDVDFGELEKIATQRYVILHPKSQGSAKEWPFENYLKLADELVRNNTIVVFTGTENEGSLFRREIPKHDCIIDATGKLSLIALFEFIKGAHGLVACSTGPYHLAGALGINAIGLFSSKKPIHPGRWHALGRRAQAVEFDPNCVRCASSKLCNCIEKIKPEKVLSLLQE